MLFTTYFFLSLTHALMTGTKEQSIFLHQSRFSWFYSYFLPRKSKNPSWLTPYAFLFVVQKVLFLLFKHPTMVVSKQRALPRKIFAKDYTGGFGAIGFVIFLDWCAMFLIRVATWKNCLAVVKVEQQSHSFLASKKEVVRWAEKRTRWCIKTIIQIENRWHLVFGDLLLNFFTLINIDAFISTIPLLPTGNALMTRCAVGREICVRHLENWKEHQFWFC